MEKTPGLLLQATPYLGKQKILKILTPGEGLISLLTKGSRNPSLTAPFCLAEWVYKKGRSDLHLLVDASLISDLLHLRQSYETLCAAGEIAQDLLRTSLPAAFSPELFALVSSIFQKLSSFDRPRVLVLFFRLKWLQLEGLFVFRPLCAVCGVPARHLHEGEAFCLSHAPPFGWTFSSEEWSFVEKILTGRTFSELKMLDPPASLYTKLSLLFQERI